MEIDLTKKTEKFVNDILNDLNVEVNPILGEDFCLEMDFLNIVNHLEDYIKEIIRKNKEIENERR